MDYVCVYFDVLGVMSSFGKSCLYIWSWTVLAFLGWPWVALESYDYLCMSLRGCCSLNMKCPLQTYVLNPWSTAGGFILGNSGGFEKWGLNGRSWSLMMDPSWFAVT